MRVIKHCPSCKAVLPVIDRLSSSRSGWSHEKTAVLQSGTTTSLLSRYIFEQSAQCMHQMCKFPGFRFQISSFRFQKVCDRPTWQVEPPEQQRLPDVAVQEPRTSVSTSGFCTNNILDGRSGSTTAEVKCPACVILHPVGTCWVCFGYVLGMFWVCLAPFGIRLGCVWGAFWYVLGTF